MNKIKLSNGTVLSVQKIELLNGILKLTTLEYTVEQLADMFSNKENTKLIAILTEAGTESGYKEGFTSFGGITYSSSGAKTIELFQPVDPTEARLTAAEVNISKAQNLAKNAKDKANSVDETINVLLGVE